HYSSLICQHPRTPTPTPFPYTTLFRSPSARTARPTSGAPNCLASRAATGRSTDLPPVTCCSSPTRSWWGRTRRARRERERRSSRSEEHTSELQSPDHLVCRLLLEKKKQ